MIDATSSQKVTTIAVSSAPRDVAIKPPSL
ncbi:hypothetical protein [Bacillus sp. FSL K6-0268]